MAGRSPLRNDSRHSVHRLLSLSPNSGFYQPKDTEGLRLEIMASVTDFNGLTTHIMYTLEVYQREMSPLFTLQYRIMASFTLYAYISYVYSYAYSYQLCMTCMTHVNNLTQHFHTFKNTNVIMLDLSKPKSPTYLLTALLHHAASALYSLKFPSNINTSYLGHADSVRSCPCSMSTKTTTSLTFASLSLQYSLQMDVAMTSVEAMNVSVLAMQRETENLTRIITCVLQAFSVMKRLERISGELLAVLDELQWQGNPMQQSTWQSQPTMQESYQRRQAALKRHRIEYDHQHQPIVTRAQ